MTTPTKYLLAALLLVGCSDDRVTSDTLQVSTGESDDASTSSGGAESTSEAESSSSGEGSSTGAESTSGDSSTGEPFQGEPDPQPGAGYMWGRCTENSMLQCPAMTCLNYEADWGEGFCTLACNTIKDCSAPGEPIVSGAELVCAPVFESTYHKKCMLACEEDAQCPSGMQCKQLPLVPADQPVQTVCA